MIEFTKVAYDELKQYEQHFIRAVKGGYIMGVNPRIANEMLHWYKPLGGNKVIKLDCSNCIYTMVKDLGEGYFRFVDFAKEYHPSWLGLPEPEPEVEEKAAEEPIEPKAVHVSAPKAKAPQKPKKGGKSKKNNVENVNKDGEDNGQDS